MRRTSYEVANIMGQARLCSTDAQARLFNNGYHWAVVEDAVTVVSLHLTERAAKKRLKELSELGDSGGKLG